MSGARQQGHACTSASYDALLTMGYDRFTTAFYGGRDGLDITEMEAFRNTKLSSGNEYTNYAFNTVKRAIDTVADPEFVEMNMLTVPGIVNENLTKKVLNVCEERGDALGIIDLRGVYQPFTENYNNFKSRVTATSLAGVVTALRDRSINSSYGCTYYPWVQVTDTMTGQRLWAPPSVAAIGTFASSESRSEVWFAPAGFNRGSLSNIVNTTSRLTTQDRDDLYEARINWALAQPPSATNHKRSHTRSIKCASWVTRTIAPSYSSVTFRLMVAFCPATVGSITTKNRL